MVQVGLTLPEQTVPCDVEPLLDEYAALQQARVPPQQSRIMRVDLNGPVWRGYGKDPKQHPRHRQPNHPAQHTPFKEYRVPASHVYVFI